MEYIFLILYQAKYKRRVQRLNSWFEGIDLNVKSNESDLVRTKFMFYVFFLRIFRLLDLVDFSERL